MLFSFLICCLLLDPVKVVKLENSGVYLSRVGYNQGYLGPDGTFLLATKFQVWHFDQDGKLINRFGQKGSGPGEFEGVGNIYWDGSHYWVIDNQNLFSSVFDKNGVFIARQPIYFRQFLPIEGRLFAVDYSSASQYGQSYPRVLQELKFTVTSNSFEVQKLPNVFVKITPAQQTMMLNFKLLWVVKDGETFFVMNQMEPRMYVYDREARAAEAALSNADPFSPPYVSLNLPHYEAPPEKFTKQRNSRAFSEWWQSWSRINYFSRFDQTFIVGYEVPDVEDPTSSIQALNFFKRDGKNVKESITLPGFLVGSIGSQLYQIRTDEDNETFEYFIDVYDLNAH